MTKVTNEKLARFLLINKQLSKLKKEQKDIRAAILATGAVSTKEFVATIETLNKEAMAGKAKFVDLFGLAYLKRQKLIRRYTSQEVNVVRKSEHIHNIKRTARA